MIAAAVTPRRCHGCQTMWATCVGAREYRSAACCHSCDHDDRVRTCTGCRADEFACARKSALGGRVCCGDCSHLVTRKVNTANNPETEAPR